VQNTTEALERSRQYVRAKGVSWTSQDDRLALVDPRGQRFFGLEGVGARIWEILVTPQTIEEIVTLLLREYDVAADVLLKDVDAFMRRLADAQLANLLVRK
jgi:hypothetical protein